MSILPQGLNHRIRGATLRQRGSWEVYPESADRLLI